MAKIVLDRGLATEKTIEVDNIYERIMEHTLNGYKTIQIAVGTTIPSIPAINDTFTTLEAESEAGVLIPIINTYNKIVNFNAQYYSEQGTYSYNIDFGYVDPNE